MSRPLSLKQNQDEIKFVNFKRFPPRSPPGLTYFCLLLLIMVTHEQMQGQPAESQLLLGIFLGGLWVSWDLHLWGFLLGICGLERREGAFVGLGVEWLSFCWSSRSKSHTQHGVTSFYPLSLLKDQLFLQCPLAPKTSWLPLDIHQAWPGTPLPTLTAARLDIIVTITPTCTQSQSDSRVRLRVPR